MEMKIDENLQKSLSLANNATAVTDSAFRHLTEDCFAVLTGSPEPHNIAALYNSKPDLVKELYAALLSATATLVQNKQSQECVGEVLATQCGYSGPKVAFYLDCYRRNREAIETNLINIGSQLPHVTDATWKIDFIVKSSCLDANQAPLFRIGLQTEKYDPDTRTKKIEFVNFSCDSQELQDLVYKLKDAVRHCQRIGSDH